MSTTKWTDYVMLPPEVSDFERRYLQRIHKIAILFFWAHVPVFMGVAALAKTGPLEALVLSLIVLSGPTLGYFTLGRHPRRLSVIYGVTAMCMGGLLVHLGQGSVQIEMHFYFFVLLALLAVTANPMAIIAAAVTVAAHHAVLFFVRPQSVFNYDAEIWVVGIHALFVVLESIAACFVARSFFDNVVGLDKIVQKRTDELDMRNRDMRTVLDHVDEGLVTLDSSGWMGLERSAAFTRWFGTAPGLFADAVRAHDVAFAGWFESAFEQLLAGFLPLDLCLDQLPLRLGMGERTLEARYQPIADATGNLSQLLVVLKDITAEVIQSRTEAEQQDITQLFEHLGRDRQGFLDFFEEAGDIVKLLTTGRGEDAVVEARLLHTLKGNAGLFGLLNLAHLCHDIETRTSELGAMKEQDRDVLNTAWERLALRVRAFIGENYRSVIQVRRDDFEDVVTALRSGAPHPEVASAVENWGLDPVSARLERLAEYARSLAPRLGKPQIDTSVSGGSLRVDGDRWAAFWAAMVHVVRNAVDHGIESADARAAAGKSDVGRMALSASIEGDAFVVRITDDGAGVDWGRAAARAEQRGMAHETRPELVAALLTDGFSTREHVTGTSGRGVGLAAVKAEVDRRRGRTTVVSEPRQGATWEFRFPRAEMLARTAVPRPSAVPNALDRIRRQQSGTAADA